MKNILEQTEQMSEIEKLIEKKGEDYGRPDFFWGSLAEIWTNMLNKHVSPKQAVAMMIALKALRAYHNVDHNDSWVDVQGYGKIGEDI